MADLVTLEQIKAYIRPSDASDDEILSSLARYASARIRTFTQRALTTPDVVENRAIHFSGTRSVRLDDKVTDIVSLAAPFPYERLLTPVEYEVREFPAGCELVLGMAAEGEALITGTWGWDEPPADLEYAAIVTIDEWYRANVISGYSDEQGEAEGRNIDLPDEVKGMLEPWKLAGALA
jgi:hypothetical protein